MTVCVCIYICRYILFYREFNKANAKWQPWVNLGKK